MTDKEKVIALLTELGVGFTLQENDVLCLQGHSKIEGYICFYTAFIFDGLGKFMSMGAFE